MSDLCVAHVTIFLFWDGSDYAFEHPCKRVQKNSSIMTEFCSVLSVSHTAEVAMVTHPLFFNSKVETEEIRRNRTCYFRIQTCKLLYV